MVGGWEGGGSVCLNIEFQLWWEDAYASVDRRVRQQFADSDSIFGGGLCVVLIVQCTVE